MKKLIALICSLSLAVQITTAQQSANLPKTTAAEYGIELEASYSGSEVLSLLLAAENETETSIKNAYAEGYKAGLLEYAPENARLASLNESLQKEASAQAAQQSLTQWVAPLAVLAGALGGFVLRSSLCQD